MKIRKTIGLPDHLLAINPFLPVPDDGAAGGTTGGAGAPPAAPAGQPPAAPPGGDPAPAGQPAAPPTDPDSPEGLQERLRRRQAVVDQQAEELRRWRALGADPTAVQSALAAAPPAAGDPAPVDVDALRAQARQEIEAEVRTEANARVLEADVRAALVGRVNISPEAALALMRTDLKGITLGADGRADRLDVEVAVRALLDREPALAVAAGPRFAAPADQGPRGGGAPKTLAEQIAEAKASGNFRLAIALETTKLAQKA